MSTEREIIEAYPEDSILRLCLTKRRVQLIRVRYCPIRPVSSFSLGAKTTVGSIGALAILSTSVLSLAVSVLQLLDGVGERCVCPH